MLLPDFYPTEDILVFSLAPKTFGMTSQTDTLPLDQGRLEKLNMKIMSWEQEMFNS